MGRSEVAKVKMITYGAAGSELRTGREELCCQRVRPAGADK